MTMSTAYTATDLPGPPAARPPTPHAARGDPLGDLLRRAVQGAPEGPARRWLERLLGDGESAAGTATTAEPTRSGA
jgi:hypothetical protein